MILRETVASVEKSKARQLLDYAMDEQEIFMEGGDGRRRSNTWPLPEPPAYVKSENDQKHVQHQQLSAVEPSPKKSSRKNAWGNMSYADLITQAIQSSEEKRLTLSQIYDWMVNSISYFKDKGDSNSSAGWKNSIRHNLSLHSKFVRVQNEGSGKSSWWTINPDAKGGKTSRRRSGSLDSAPKTERKGRGRSKKEKKEVDEAPTSPHLSVITKANRSPSPSTVSPTSSSSDSLQTIPESSDSPLPFFLNDSFGRPRTNSDLSTVSVNSLGRSGSPVVDELDNEEPICVPTITSTPNPVADELIELADSMTLEPYNNGTMKTNLSPVSALLPHDQPQNDLNMTNMNSTLPVNGFENGYENGFLPGAPAQQQQLNPEVMQTTVQQLYTGVRVSQFQGGFTRQDLATQDAPRMMQPPPYPEHNMEIQQTHANMFSGFGFGSNNQRPNQNSQPQNCNFTDPYLHQVTTPSIIIENHPLQQNLNRMANQLDFMSQKFPSDLELCDTFEGGLECDMDSIIHDELSMGDGALDFNFEQFISQSAFPNTPPVTVGELSGRLY